MTECPHGMDDPRTCSLCKNGPSRPKRKRRPSSAPKDGTFTCTVCAKSKNLDQLRTKHDPITDTYPRNPDKICRPCDKEIVAYKAAHKGTTRPDAIEHIARKYQGPPAVVTVNTEQDAAKHAAAVESKGSGQGFKLDQEMKDAVEDHAVVLARIYFSQLGTTEVVGDRKTWDLECLVDGSEKHIEVKGTSTEGAQIFLTQNQVDHYRTYPHVALFLVSKIKVERDEDRNVKITEPGESTVFDPWVIDPEHLQTIQYRYSVR